jgi:hypothetical protein
MEVNVLKTKQTNHSRHAAGNRHQPARDRATDQWTANHPPPYTGRNRAGTQLPCRGHRAGRANSPPRPPARKLEFLHPGHRQSRADHNAGEPHRAFIEAQLRLRRNYTAINRPE